MSLNEIVARTLDCDPALVNSVLSAYSQAMLVAVAMQGPTRTIFGTLALDGDQLVIIEQNPRVSALMRGDISADTVLAQVSDIVSGVGL